MHSRMSLVLYGLQLILIVPWSLLRLMKKERNIMRAMEALGLAPNEAIEVLTHHAIGLAQSDLGVLDGICDASDRPEGGEVIFWWNDIEIDTR
jgi:UDP-glucose:glycoprotein glucosyltransferase